MIGWQVPPLRTATADRLLDESIALFDGLAHAPRPVLRPGVLLGSCLLILAVPALGVSVLGALAAIAAICAAVVALTLAGRR